MTSPHTRLHQRVRAFFPAGQVVRYLIVGGVNTAIGTGFYVFILFLLNCLTVTQIHGFAVTQARLAIAANLLSTPINITISYLNYKFFVFRTRGNYLKEWLRAFGVYGVSNLVGLVVLGALTRAIELALHSYAPFGKGTPGYIAGIAMTLVTTVISYVGHKKVTFGGSPGHDEETAASQGLLGTTASAKLEATLQEPQRSE